MTLTLALTHRSFAASLTAGGEAGIRSHSGCEGEGFTFGGTVIQPNQPASRHAAHSVPHVHTAASPRLDTAAGSCLQCLPSPTERPTVGPNEPGPRTGVHTMSDPNERLTMSDAIVNRTVTALKGTQRDNRDLQASVLEHRLRHVAPFVTILAAYGSQREIADLLEAEGVKGIPQGTVSKLTAIGEFFIGDAALNADTEGDTTVAERAWNAFADTLNFVEVSTNALYHATRDGYAIENATTPDEIIAALNGGAKPAKVDTGDSSKTKQGQGYSKVLKAAIEELRVALGGAKVTDDDLGTFIGTTAQRLTMSKAA